MRISILLLPLLFPLLQGRFGVVRAQGSLVITGHDADSHHMMYPKGDHQGTEQFITACLDFLVFGKKASPEQIGKRAQVRIAYIDENMQDVVGFSDYFFKLVSGYTNPTVFKLREQGWKRALDSGAFDVVIVGWSRNFTEAQYLRMMEDLARAKSDFKTFLNRGGNLFVMVQGNYAFLPTFGAVVDDMGDEVGQFYVTPAGNNIGLEDNMVNQDPTHHQYKNVDTSIFKIFERSRIPASDGQVNLPLTIGFRGTIDSVFIPDPVYTVQKPRSSVPSGPFTDSVCVEFFTPTDSATLSYSLNGAVTATSPTLANHSRLCFRQTTTIRLIGKRAMWKDSPDTAFTYTVVARPPSTLALFANGREITEVTAADSPLEVRLMRPAGLACAGCSVKANPSGGSDTESLPLRVQGAFFTTAFARAESLVPVPGDGTLQHKASDSLVLTWTNPQDDKDVVRRSYPYRPDGSVLALFAGGQVITEVTFTDVQLEARLSRPTGLACAGCTVQVTPSGSLDSERLPLTAQGAFFHASFARAESLAPIAGDGTLQHGPADSVVLIWVNPQDARDKARRAYPYRPKPPVIPLAPALSLVYRGQEITVVDASQKDLDIHLTLDSTEACASCPVLVFPSTGSDTETVLLAGGISPYQGSFKRDLQTGGTRGDGTIQHERQDSIILLYRNPMDPAKVARRSYPFQPARDTMAIRPQGAIANTAGGQYVEPGPQWIISDAPGLMIDKQAGDGSCCALAPTPVNAQNPDSLRLVGIVIEASHGFSLDLRVFSTLGEPVSRVAFTVPESEFPKLTRVAGKETRTMRLLWNGRTRAGSRAGNGAYVLRTSISLLPLAQSPGAPGRSTTDRRIGILRSGN